MATKNLTEAESKPWKLLLWTAVAGLIFGLIGFGEIAEDYLRTVRNSFHRHAASGQVAVLMIDDKALHELGNWPWRRSVDAELVDKLTAAGVKGIYWDVNFSFPSARAEDQAFADALRRSRRVTLLTRSRMGAGAEAPRMKDLPLPALLAHAKIATGSVHYNYQNAVWKVPYGTQIGRAWVPSFAAAIAGIQGSPESEFRIDYSIARDSIPSYSAADALRGRIGARQLSGKQVLIGIGTDVLGDNFFIPGDARSFGVYVHAIAAETLLAGSPVDLGWLLPFALALAAVAAALYAPRFIFRLAVLSTTAIALTAGPTFLEAYRIFADVTPALFVVLLTATVLVWRAYRARGHVNPVSNLPNLNSLRQNVRGRQQALVAARIVNYEEIVSSLPPHQERQLVEQIAARLRVGAPQRTLYHGDAGIFAWFEDSQQPFGNHLEALHALFRNPARLNNVSIDLTVSFGVEVGSGRSLPNRLASALVAADEAAHQGLKWRFHDPESLADATWKLSMLSQLDEAVDRGEVWVAFQPKLDIETKRIIGAEALARWTHPIKGPIAASEFVAAAEQHNRIGKLTDHVLEEAVRAAAQINRRGIDFGIAVNLSARLLTDKGLPLRLAATLARHGLAPAHLTLELTETAALADGAQGLEMINRIRDLGILISIDDYGTGQSTLDYLKKIPATEIKIDQSFIKGIVDNRSDRLMVQSTIGLVHSLGRRVVAEGVEHRDILDVLVQLGCDVAQGFAIGRPMSLDSLTKRLTAARRSTAA